MKVISQVGPHTYFVETNERKKGWLTRVDDETYLFTPQNGGAVLVCDGGDRTEVVVKKFRGDILSPSQGRLVRLPVKIGDIVESGRILCAVEVMKMNLEIRAETKMQIVQICANVGDLVQNKQLLIIGREVS